MHIKSNNFIDREKKRERERGELEKNKMEFKKKLVYHFKANPEQNRRVFP